MWPLLSTRLRQPLPAAERIPPRPNESREDPTPRKILFLLIFLLFAICLFVSVSRAGQHHPSSAKLTGTVFVEDSSGTRSVVAGAKVILAGPSCRRCSELKQCPVTDMVAGWLPARIGADESGAATAFAAPGLSSASGAVLALTRRFRDLLWCLLGLTWLAWRSRKSVREQLPEGALLACKQS